MGKFQKCTPATVTILFQPNLWCMFPMTGIKKLPFGILNFIFGNKDSTFQGNIEGKFSKPNTYNCDSFSTKHFSECSL